MTTTKVLAASDAMVSSGYPTKNYGGSAVLNLSALPSSRQAFVFFNQPFPRGVEILSATLRMYQKGSSSGGTRKVTVQRVASAWVEARVTYDNRPTATGPVAEVSKGNSTVDGREWAFDVKAAMQQVSDGASWDGFRLVSDNATNFAFYGREGAGAYTPTLEVTWSDAPSAPIELSPSAGRSISVTRPTLRCDFFDPDGDLTAVQFQVSTTDSFTAPAFDSGELPAELPEWKLTGDLVDGLAYYWRARVKDAAGLWSPFSETALFYRTGKPVVTITSPSSGSPVIYESTPTFSWVVPSLTQVAYQVLVVNPLDTADVILNSTKVTSQSTAYTVSAANQLVLTPGGSYRLVVRVWDDVARESIPEEPAYVEVAQDFTFGTSGAVAGVTGLSVVVAAESPFATLEFQRSTAPDSFMVVEGGEVIAVLDPDDIFVSGTTYRYVDRRVTPGSSRTWGVAARVGAQTSDFSTTSGTAKPEGVWLYDLQGSDAVCIWGIEDPEGMVSSEASEDTAVFKPVGSANPVLITQAIRGPEGDVKGTINRSDLAAWNRLTARRAVTLGMTRVDLVQKVQVFNTWRDHADEFDQDIIPIAFDFVVMR